MSDVLGTTPTPDGDIVVYRQSEGVFILSTPGPDMNRSTLVLSAEQFEEIRRIIRRATKPVEAGTEYALPDDIPPPLTRADLDADEPAAGFCAKVRQNCHPGRPLRAAYQAGNVVLRCDRCDKFVEHFRVAE